MMSNQVKSYAKKDISTIIKRYITAEGIGNIEGMLIETWVLGCLSGLRLLASPIDIEILLEECCVVNYKRH